MEGFTAIAEVLMAPGLVLAVVMLILCQPLAFLLRLLWAASAALLLRECDFLTKILPENKAYWRGRVAWVTGASSGIGLSLCRMLAARRCMVILSSRREEDLIKARDDAIAYSRSVGVKRSPDDFLILPFDMKTPRSFSEVVDNGREWKGKIDFLFSNAGVACRGVMLPSSVDTEIIEVNLTSQMAFVKLVVARMIQQQAGHVIFTNSMSARITLGGRTAYSAAKGALLNFAYGLTRELRAMGSPVQVTSVLPGYIRTDLCDRELYADGSVIPKGSHVAEDIRQGLSSDRTAELMLRGSSRGLSEIWIGKNPDLFYMYSAYYYPGVTNLLVNYGAASYARSIEQEIRERRNAARRAAAAGAADKSPAVDRLGSFKKRKAERSAAAEEDVAAAKEAPEKATVEPAAADKPPALPSAQDAVDTVAGVISDAVTQLTKLASFGSDSTKDEEDSLRKERRNHDDQPVKGSVTEGTRTTRTVPPPQPVPPVHDGRRAEL